MVQVVLIILWLGYCLVNSIQVIKTAAKKGDDPLAHRYARTRFVRILIASLMYLALTAFVYAFF